MAKILVAMSGGVDSSVAAALLVSQGHEVSAAYMKNWINEENILGDCPWQQDITDAQAVSEKLGIPFRVVNLMDDYREKVVKYLLEGYQSGITPNPDVMCNREIKFGVFLEYALSEGFDSVATGHYAQISHDSDTGDVSSRIRRGRDPDKDQTYFLAMLQQRQANRALFPIGGLLKAEVREQAAALGLATAVKKDSQGICFIGQVKMSDFLSAFVADAPGQVVTADGRKLGEHRGLHLYTLGQRKGLGIASPVFKEPWVVVEKRPETRELVLAFDRPETPGLYASRAVVSNLSWVHGAIAGKGWHQAQPRYRCAGQDALLTPMDGNKMLVEFRQPQRALSPGQICAFYDGDELRGGGIFQQIDAQT